MGGQRHGPAALPPKTTLYSMHRRLGDPQGRCGRLKKVQPYHDSLPGLSSPLSFHTGPSIYLSILFTNTLGVCSSPNARGQVSRTYKTTGNFTVLYILMWVTRWRSWSIHCATSRKVAGSISDGVIQISPSHNPSGRTMALRATQHIE